MIDLFVWGSMYLAWTIEYAVQAGWSLTVPFVGLLPLADLEPLNPALTVVSSVLSPLLQCLCLLRRGLLLLSLASEVPGFLDVLLL